MVQILHECPLKSKTMFREVQISHESPNFLAKQVRHQSKSVSEKLKRDFVYSVLIPHLLNAFPLSNQPLALHITGPSDQKAFRPAKACCT